MTKNSRVVNLGDFHEDWFHRRTRELGERFQLHRKLWEFCAIAEVIATADSTGPPTKALGFGVGREPIAAWLANRGVQVVATDRPDETAEWTATGQHARGLDDLFKPDICSREAFDRWVTFRDVDMNAIPDDLTGFDYTWSSGSFEHIGSFEASLTFFCRQMHCLKPGGIAVHTTEYNPDASGTTLETHDLVLFREQELRELDRRVTAQGDSLMPIDFSRDHTDVVGADGMPHINFRIGPYVTTSILLIAVKG